MILFEKVRYVYCGLIRFDGGSKPACECDRSCYGRNKMAGKIKLKALEMTPELMQKMEDEGLIERLCPGKHDLNDTPRGETRGASLYEGVEGYGPHKIIVVTVNREGFAGFGTHPDQEEFWLVGSRDAMPMYILIARMDRESFEVKAKAGTLTKDDFYLLLAKYNDPLVSFFIMKRNIPHGEGIFDEGGLMPSFYVTESRDLPLDLCEIGCEVVPA